MSDYDEMFGRLAEQKRAPVDPVTAEIEKFLHAFEKSQGGLVKIMRDSDPGTPVWKVEYQKEGSVSLAELDIALGDVNKDGKIDIAVLLRDGSYDRTPVHALKFDTSQTVLTTVAERHLSSWDSLRHPFFPMKTQGYYKNIDTFGDAEPAQIAKFLVAFGEGAREKRVDHKLQSAPQSVPEARGQNLA